MNRATEVRRIQRIINNDDANAITLLHAAGLLDPDMLTSKMPILSHAIERNKPNAMMALLNAGADPLQLATEAFPHKRQTPIMKAIEANDPTLFKTVWDYVRTPEAKQHIIEERIAKFDRENAEVVLRSEPDLQIDPDRVLGLTRIRKKHSKDDFRWLVRVLESRNEDFHMNSGDEPVLHRFSANVYLTNPLEAAHFVEMLGFMVELGADPNHLDRSGRTPIMVAICSYSTAVAHALLPLTTNLNVIANTPEARWTALDFAASKGQPTVVAELLRGGATSADGTIGNAIKHAIPSHDELSRQKRETLTTLLDFPLADVEQREVLAEAIKKHNVETVEMSLKKFPHLLHAPLPPNDRSALVEGIESWATVAPLRQSVDTVMAIIDAGADLNDVQPDDGNFIHTIIDCVLNAERSKRATAFMLSRAKEFMFCKHIKNFDTPDAAGNTPLQRAMNANHNGLVELLLDMGASRTP